jgi:hypothetical protein
MNKIITYRIALCFISGVLCAHCAYAENPASPTFEYESKGKRDPFVPLIGQEKAKKISGLVDITSVEDIKIEGIAMGANGKNIAILNGQMVREDDKFGVVQIKKISQNSVQLSIEGKNYTLELPKPEEENKIGKE